MISLGQQQKLPKRHNSIRCAHFGETQRERERESLVVRCWHDTVTTNNIHLFLLSLSLSLSLSLFLLLSSDHKQNFSIPQWGRSTPSGKPMELSRTPPRLDSPRSTANSRYPHMETYSIDRFRVFFLFFVFFNSIH